MILNEKFIVGVSDAISELRPNAVYELYNTQFTKWYDTDGLPPPSWDEIEAVRKRHEEEYARQEYARNRAKEYYPVGEQLDMLWHAISSGIDLKNSEWFSHIKQVKEKYPKP